MGGIKMGGGFSPARKNLKLVVFTWNPGACADAKFPKPRNANAVIATMLNVFIAVSFWFVSWRKNAAGLLMLSSLDEHHSSEPLRLGFFGRIKVEIEQCQRERV